jgi:hypothetical protein
VEYFPVVFVRKGAKTKEKKHGEGEKKMNWCEELGRLKSVEEERIGTIPQYER